MAQKRGVENFDWAWAQFRLHTPGGASAAGIAHDNGSKSRQCSGINSRNGTLQSLRSARHHRYNSTVI